MVTEINGNYGTQYLSSTTQSSPTEEEQQPQKIKLPFFNGESSSSQESKQKLPWQKSEDPFRRAVEYLKYTVGSYECKVDDYLKDLSQQEKDLLLENFSEEQLAEDYEGCLRLAAKRELAAQEATIINCILYPHAVFQSNGTDNNGEYHQYHNMQTALKKEIDTWIHAHGFDTVEEAREALKKVPSYRYNEAKENQTIAMESKIFAAKEGTGKVSERPYVISEETGEKLYGHVKCGDDPSKPDNVIYYRDYNLIVQESEFGV